MNLKTKRLRIFGLLLLFSVVLLALGLKYLPFTRVSKIPSVSNQSYVDPQKTQALSPNTLYYDFEVAPGKEAPGGFYKGLAHSGQYSVKAFGKNSFSMAVERTAREIGMQNMKAVALSAWVYVFPTKNEVNGNMVFTATNESGVNVCWEGIGVVDPEVPRGKWFKISKYFDLTAVSFKPDYKIQIYFWNNSRTDILIDDYTVVFGGPVDRRGDSAWVDMTKPGGFTPRFNYPPFPVSMLQKETTLSLPELADISTNDLVIAGNFLNTGNDGLFVIRKDGHIGIYAFCTSNSEFRKITLNNPSALASVQPVKKMLKGKFLGTKAEQLILISEKEWMLCAIEPLTNLCTASGGLQTSLKIMWKSGMPASSIFSGDFNGDHRSEIMIIEDNGSWKVMAFETTGNAGSAWKVIAEDDHDPVKDWNKSNQEVGIYVGRFIPGSANELVLTVIRNKGEKKFGYSLRKLNSSRMRWDPLFGENHNYVGKTIGLDTLKPSDLFFIANADNGNETKVYRYNRDWRFDLKEISFNDSTFRILSGVDFSGCEKGSNPKYYESLTLIPGYFLSPSSFSFLTIGSVEKERHYESILPDFVHLYSLTGKKKQ
ncbi:MAG: hypothetical protein WCK84_02150 [Bacteroidota bacterium]